MLHLHHLVAIVVMNDNAYNQNKTSYDHNIVEEPDIWKHVIAEDEDK